MSSFLRPEDWEHIPRLRWVYPEDLKVEPPFSNIFNVDPEMVKIIRGKIAEDGFDAHQPINVWAGRNIVLDGHTRREAAIGLGCLVAVADREFDDEDAAVDFALGMQANRRNITDAELARIVRLVDNRHKPGG